MQWITEGALDTWARTLIGRAEVARLVGNLIWATAKTLHSFRFPSGDASQIQGFDGHLITEAGLLHPFVPAGESVWEFGTSEEYVQKANDDYKNRSNNPGTIVPAKCSFVFVTPRIWSKTPTLLDWENEKTAQGKWSRVLAIDATGLATWLEQCEAVAKDFAKEVKGFAPVDGVRSVREFWESYSERFNPPLVERAVLCERDAEAQELIKQLLTGTPQVIKLQADSSDEVVAFAAAAIRTAEPPVKDYLEARTLVVDTREAVAQRTNPVGMVFLPREAAVDAAGSLSYRSPTVVPVSRVDSSAKPLRRPTAFELQQALKGMGVTDERAERLSKECGRSVTILERRIPRIQRPEPPWSSSPGLLAALLAGSWDDSMEGDQAALETLAGCKYDELDASIRQLLSLPEPLEREGSV